MTRGSGARHVVCAVDSQMVYGLAVALSSLRETSDEVFGVTVGYLEGTLGDHDRTYLERVMNHCGIRHSFVDLGSDPRFITQGHISPTTFAKFLLADAHAGAHLWIDADTVALPGWDTIFSLIDSTTPEQGLVVAERGADKLGLPFNAGVLGWPAGSRRPWSKRLDDLDAVDTQEQFLFNQLYSDSARVVSERYNSLTYRIDKLPSSDRPYIIHYAGAHKPWHLPRHYANRCTDYECPWSAWFVAEASFIAGIDDAALKESTRERQTAARRSGAIRWRRDHSGRIFLRILEGLGPWGRPLVQVLGFVAFLVPRGTHPIH